MHRWIVLGLCAMVLAMAVGFTLLAQEVVPAGIPQQAFAALLKAKQWRQDATLVIVEVNDYGGTGKFTVKFSFYSPTDRTGLWVIANGPGSNTVAQAGAVNWGTQPIPALFLDLPGAVQEARALGMQGKVDHATLRVTASGLSWEIAPAFDANLRTFAVSANLGGNSSASPGAPPSQSLRKPQQPGSDLLIVPGQRIGPVSLGMTTLNTLKALNQQSEECTSDLLNHEGTENIIGSYKSVIGNAAVPTAPINGFDPGNSLCDFGRWGLSINFQGDPNSPQGSRKAIWIAASAADGDGSRRYTTDRGIRIGSSDQDVLKAYGNVQKKNAAFGEIQMTYAQMGIEFTLGGSGSSSEKLPQNIVEKIAVSKPRP